MGSPEQVTGGDSTAAGPGRGRRLARWVWALGLSSLLGAGGYLSVRWEHQLLPVRVVSVSVKGALRNLSLHELQGTVAAHLDGGILTQDLGEIKTAVEAMPWVRSASLRRHWPDRLELVVTEYGPIARWGEDALVSADGVIFSPEDEGFPSGLAKLSGAARDASRLVRRFLDWEPRLRALGPEIETLVLDERGAWTLHLSPGFSLALGKTQIRERLSRFMRVYPKLAASGTLSLVDMRYSNGLAIRWAEVEGRAPTSDTAVGARSAELKSRFSGGFSRESLLELVQSFRPATSDQVGGWPLALAGRPSWPAARRRVETRFPPGYIFRVPVYSENGSTGTYRQNRQPQVVDFEARRKSHLRRSVL